MADFIKGLFGGQQKVAQPHSGGEDDFADYAGAPDPSPALSFATTTGLASAAPTETVGQAPYTAWYRVWERTSLDDFKLELYVLPFIVLVVLVHIWGTRRNRSKATHWIKAHAPVLQQEFAQVGYVPPQAGADAASAVDPANLLREKKLDEFASYATGRANVAFVDFKLTLAKRYNPLMRVGESLFSIFFDSLPPPVERMEATTYVFDGREAQVVPAVAKGAADKVASSTYDGFVFAVVHKDLMKRLREDRYDLSLTASKDHAKLPVWVTVMSESAEITDTLLTPELVKAITDAGDAFEALVVTDQPIDHPKKLDDTVPRKRLSLSLKLLPTGASYDSTLPLFHLFLRLPDFLVAKAHFRPEAMRRIRATREEQIARIRKLDDEEKAEERKLQGDKLKKEKRDALLSRMSADEQRKYLDKERDRDSRKRMKRQTVKA